MPIPAVTSDPVAFVAAYLGICATLFSLAALLRPGQEPLDRAQKLSAAGVLLAGSAAAVAYFDAALDFTDTLDGLLVLLPPGTLALLVVWLFVVLPTRAGVADDGQDRDRKRQPTYGESEHGARANDSK